MTLDHSGTAVWPGSAVFELPPSMEASLHVSAVKYGSRPPRESVRMHPFPHFYTVNSHANPSGAVTLSASNVPELASQPPREFDGPGDQWSPEGLLTAAVADCFVLNFRAIAAASKFAWTELSAATEGRLDRVEGKMRFTSFTTKASLTVPQGAAVERAKKLLERAEQTCPVANSLTAERHLEASITVS